MKTQNPLYTGGYGVNTLKDYFQEIEVRGLEQIRYLQGDIAAMNRLREAHPGDWELEEVTRAIIYDESQIIEMIREEIEHERADLKKLD